MSSKVPFAKRRKTGSAPIPKSWKAYVQKAIVKEQEMKYWEIDYTTSASSAIFGYANLMDIPQGDGANERIGNQIRVHKIEIKGAIEPGDNSNNTRLIIGTNIGDTPSAPTSIISNLFSSGVDHRVDVLWDKFYTPCYLSAHGNGTAQSAEYKNVHFKKKVNWLVKYASGSTLPPYNRSYFSQFHADSALIPHPRVTAYSKVWFTDA